MTTERDAYGIYHIDGPPYAGFDVMDGDARVEVRYKLLIYIGTKAEVEEAYKNLLNIVVSELQDLVQIDNASSSKFRMARPIIWWRRRVEFAEDPEEPGRWKFSCRFDTTPPLPTGFWEQWGCQEGAVARRAKEVVG